MPLPPTTNCTCKITAFPPPFPVPRLPNLDELHFTKKTTNRFTNRSPFTWNSSRPQRRRDRQTDGHNRDCKPWLSVLLSKCPPGQPHCLVSQCALLDKYRKQKVEQLFQQKRLCSAPREGGAGSWTSRTALPIHGLCKRPLLRQVPLHTHTPSFTVTPCKERKELKCTNLKELLFWN